MGNYINEKDAMARLGNNKKLYGRLLAQFDGVKMLDALKAAVSSGDAAGAQAQAHAIKGLAANLSLQELCEKAGAIELALKKSGAVDGVDTDGISAAAAATAEAVKAWLSENP